MTTLQTNESLISLYKKMHSIMEAIQFIEKDKKNLFHNYKYASEEAIKKAVHAQLVKHKVLFHITANELTRTEILTSKEKKSYLTDIKFTYSFVDIETGSKIEGTAYGTGEDNTDKGTYKAITGAIKYILTSTFLIPTGDDPETEVPAVKMTGNPATEKPWITDKATGQAAERIKKGEVTVYQKVTDTYRISAKNLSVLNAALKLSKGVAA